MPPGSVHTSNTIATSVLLAIGSIFINPSLLSDWDCFYVVAGCLSGVLLSPDLDVNGGYIGLHFLRRIWVIGPVLSFLWWLFWSPYRIIVPHRSKISHLPFLSTILRELILIIPTVIIMYYYGIPVQFAWRPIALFTIGLTISDSYHAYADWLSGEIRE